MSGSDLTITDAQVHIWAADTPARPWIPGGSGYAHSQEPLTARSLLNAMKDAGVRRAVLVPPSWEGDRNDVVAAAARTYPDRFAAMGRIPLQHEIDAEALAEFMRGEQLAGVRLTFARGEQRRWLTDGTADWFWLIAEEAGIPIMLFAPGQLPAVGEIAHRHPGLKLIIDHIGLPVDAIGMDLRLLIQPALALARYPNVAVKASALPCLVSERYPFPSLHEPIRMTFEAFGPERVFWGSDLSRLPCSYREAITLFTEELAFLSDSDKTWIMGQALAEWLNWPLQDDAR